ncbi:MAG TPA: hypothetical protein VLA74_10425 [Nitrososphaeraceae archaeon]|nr:hypothetical protein [Nitrososphaeraceae archaeon]
MSGYNVEGLKGSSSTVTTPYLRATSKASFRRVHASSIKVVGRDEKISISLDAIHIYLTDNCLSDGKSLFNEVPTKNGISVAHPTQDPVANWSPIFH